MKTITLKIPDTLFSNLTHTLASKKIPLETCIQVALERELLILNTSLKFTFIPHRGEIEAKTTIASPDASGSP